MGADLADQWHRLDQVTIIQRLLMYCMTEYQLAQWGICLSYPKDGTSYIGGSSAVTVPYCKQVTGVTLVPNRDPHAGPIRSSMPAPITKPYPHRIRT